MVNLAIFASGGGSNAERIINYFKKSPMISIQLIVSNNINANVLNIAKSNNIETLVVSNKHDFLHSNVVLGQLRHHNIDYIILAGFLWLIPKDLVDNFPNKILNIHPSLLPKYGGKGMYGINVHKAVKENNELASGMTIHVVNERFDDGDIIFQAKCKLELEMTPEHIGREVLKLEHFWYSKIIESYILRSNMY
jgi:phosphoribosylglycinamide formyltransferase-1